MKKLANIFWSNDLLQVLVIIVCVVAFFWAMGEARDLVNYLRWGIQ